ncbi:expressed unknown protein [Seminavis robusta]|uniref:Uncharacterized protein n=1 Tax=Seminavis robusta TaxID=568900 RepID=A0A9N8HCS8_9STRA|nr:expressed unknown protein [Seminavis robusta]|eukprot:Sro315_g115270.1 n/a (312) ;mRNA; f:25410-26345
MEDGLENHSHNEGVGGEHGDALVAHGDQDYVAPEEGEESEVADFHERILSCDDPRRMEISPEEREWAEDIKAVIEGIEEIDNLSDFMYAQLAIIHGEDISTAVEIANRLQEARQEYDIEETFEDGVVKLQKLIRLCPKANMYFGYNNERGCYTQVFDYGKLDMDLMKQEKNAHATIAASYYQYHCFAPDFEAVRKGTIWIAECQGYQWMPKRGGLRYSERFWNDLGSAYPQTIQEYNCFHTPAMFNVMKSMLRPFIAQDIYSKINLGCSFPGGRLDSVYMIPTPQIAEQRVLSKWHEALELRFANEQSFAL